MFNALYWAPPTSTSMHADERGEGYGGRRAAGDGRPAQTVKRGPTTLSGFLCMNCAILPQKGKARKRVLRVMGVVGRWYIHTRE